uniref:Single-stranded DNA-binding protein n=1 Tax=Rhizobium phage IG49 TaxID=3129228 RepID=A0AAU8HYJ2_9CAUD
MSFASLRERAKNIEEVRDEVAPNEGEGGDRYLQIGIDKTGVAYVRGRFMPAPDGERSSIVTSERFKFQNDSGTKEYYGLSLRNLPDPDNPSKRQLDPVQPYLDALWKAGDKDLYRKRKKKTPTYVNFYVEEDKVNPENNGKVFLWRIPYEIHDMVKVALKPVEDKYDQSKTPKAFNPFDLFGEAGGRDFIIRIKDKDGKNDYSGSHFADKPNAFLDGDEEKMEAAWKSCHSLFHFVDPARHKTREELIKMLIDVVGPRDKYLSEIYPEECEEFLSKGRGSKSEEKSEGKREEREEKKSEQKKEEKAPKTSAAEDLDIDF